MQVRDAMTTSVATIGQEATVREAAKLMLQRRVSALPVLGPKDRLVGIISEGDLVRRAELGTDQARSWWLRLLAFTGENAAADYVKTHPQHTGKRCDDQSRDLRHRGNASGEGGALAGEASDQACSGDSVGATRGHPEPRRPGAPARNRAAREAPVLEQRSLAKAKRAEAAARKRRGHHLRQCVGFQRDAAPVGRRSSAAAVCSAARTSGDRANNAWPL